MTSRLMWCARIAAAGAFLSLTVSGTQVERADAQIFATGPSRATLKAFRSEQDLANYLKRLPRRPYPPPPPPPAPPPPGAGPAVAAMDAKISAEDVGALNSITNNQVTGVDEGDIVKARGNMLVVLRRGRLFTVSIAGGIKPVDSIDAFPSGVDARGDWYDEMLIAGDRVVVIGYSYSRGGTQINRFRIDDTGHLSFIDAYQLRSNDYYSAENYASRLIGTRLIVYAPRFLPYADGDRSLVLPALRRWTAAEGIKGRFQRIGTAREVYLSPGVAPEDITAMHTVTSCDLATEIMQCKATSVLGPSGRVFFVSNNAVYIWVTTVWSDDKANRPTALLYRLPLDGSAPTAVGARGAPVDQFSFRADPAHGKLDVLVRAHSAGDGMWASHFASGGVALVHIPTGLFGDGTREIPFDKYRALPAPKSVYGLFHNRFVGDYVLYGNGNTWWSRPQSYDSVLFVAPVAAGEATMIGLPHGIDRIDAMGRDAIVVGSDAGSVYFSAISLKATPAAGDRYVLADAAQSETRSHGFFFKPERDPVTGATDGGFGVVGLPITHPAKEAYRQLFTEAAAITFVRRVNGKFVPLGELSSHPEGAAADNCVASCVDWYGNSRPIFLRDRTFALMGYEIVEGTLGEKDLREKDRMSFAPKRANGS